MMHDLLMYDWVLKPVVKYSSQKELMSHFKAVVIDRAWSKHKELQGRKRQALTTVTIDEFLGVDHTPVEL